MGTRRIRRGNDEFTLFYRKVSPFSNHHPAEFECGESLNFKETKRFSCSEQYYMFNKASLIKDTKLMENVLKSDNPKDMKAMCLKPLLRGWSDATWDEHKEQVMYNGNLAKFRANQHLRYALFITIGSRLVECNPTDKVWGIGKDLRKSLNDDLNTTGQNLMGKILDRVRDELWKDISYRDEREEVEKRMRNDKDYLYEATKHVDLMYKARAVKRHLMYNRHIHGDDQRYVTPEVRLYLPEWGIPSRVEKEEPIRPSPPQFVTFPRTPSPIRHQSPSLKLPVTPPAGTRSDRHSENRKTERTERRRSRSRSRSRGERRRSRSPTRRERNSSRDRNINQRSRSRSRSRRDRNERSRHTSPLPSGSRKSLDERISSKRRKSRSKSSDDRKRRRSRSRSNDRNRKAIRRRSRSHERSRRNRSRSRSGGRLRREKSKCKDSDRKQRHSNRSKSPKLGDKRREAKKRVKRRKLRSKNKKELARSKLDERSADNREPKSETEDDECQRKMKKMKKLLKKQIREKRKRARNPPPSTSSESEGKEEKTKETVESDHLSSSPSD